MNQNEFLPRFILIPYFGDKEIVGVEIGTGGGGGNVAMLMRAPNIIKLYCVDPWKHVEGAHFEAARPQEWHDLTYNAAVKRLEAYKDRTVILKMGSDEAINHTPDEIDFVWVDGNHEEEQFKRDVINWLPKVRMGGIYGGHDYQIRHIREIVTEELGWHNTGEDFTWWYIKKSKKSIMKL